MSNEFCLPVAVDLLPRARVAAGIVALHCLTLPVLLLPSALPLPWIGALAAGVVAHLAWRLHRQCAVGAANRLEANVNGWRLRAAHDESQSQSQWIDRIDSLDFGRIIVLRAARGRRSFHLAARADGTSAQQQHHRLRVLLRAPPSPARELRD